MATQTNLLTTAQAARIVGVSADWIAQCCQNGRFPGAIQPGRDWLIPRAEVEAFAAAERPRGNPNWRKAPPLGKSES